MLSHPSVSILVGKCKSGKTHLLKYLLYELGCKQKIDLVLLFSRTSESEQYDFIPQQWRHPDFNLDIFKKIVKMQRRSKRKFNKQANIVLIIDDGNSSSKSKTEDFINLINSHRHYNISVILCMQYLSGNVSTNYREVADNCFVFKADTSPGLSGNFNAFFSTLGLNIDQYTSMNASLPRYNFFHINKENGSIKTCIAPHELPDFEFIYRESATLS